MMFIINRPIADEIINQTAMPQMPIQTNSNAAPIWAEATAIPIQTNSNAAPIWAEATASSDMPIQTNLNTRGPTLEQLRQECRDKGLKVSGNKQDLIDRLNANRGNMSMDTTASSKSSKRGGSKTRKRRHQKKTIKQNPRKLISRKQKYSRRK
jgi:hypothetical protein